MRRIMVIAAVAALGAAVPANAQAQGRGNGGIPPGQRPPAGMCRVWIDGVPPGPPTSSNRLFDRGENRAAQWTRHLG